MEDIIETKNIALWLLQLSDFTWRYFLFIDLSQVHPPYRIFIRLRVQLSRKGADHQFQRRRRLLCLMHLEIITVGVKGAVKQPGVYELRSNSRVHDAIYKAGG